MTRGSQMSFTELKLNELKKVAESFAVDTEGLKTKQEIVAAIQEEGVTYQMYDKLKNAEKQEIEIPESEKIKRERKIMSKTTNQVLVKMERNNHSYEIRGYAFSQEHPFMAMSESEAQRIFDTEVGFRIATPREAQEYYA